MIKKINTILFFFGFVCIFIAFLSVDVFMASQNYYDKSLLGRLIRYAGLFSLSISSLSGMFLERNKGFKTSHVTVYLLLLSWVFFVTLWDIEEFLTLAKIFSPKGWGTWLILGNMFLFYDDERWELFKKFVPYSIIVTIIHLLIQIAPMGFFYNRLEIEMQIRLHVVFLAWTVPFFFLLDSPRKSYTTMQILFFVSLVIGGLLVATRSWIILASFVLFIKIFPSSKAKYANKLAPIMIAVLVVVFILNSSNLFFSNTLQQSLFIFVNRIEEDSRLAQLGFFLQHLNSLSLQDLIWGSGATATWSWLNGVYSWVDNQWLLFLWWAGVPLLLSYAYLAFSPIRLAFKYKLWYDQESKALLVGQILWVLGLSGLAIFSTPSATAYFIVIIGFSGRLMHLTASAGREEVNTEPVHVLS